MPAPKFQLIVDVIGTPPRNGSSHPWRRTTRAGVVTVERAPGVSRDASTRPVTPDERDAMARAMHEASVAGERMVSIATRYQRSKNQVVGMVDRYRRANGIAPAPRRGSSVTAPPVRPKAARDEAVIAALRDGATPARLAVEHGIAADTVRAIRARAVHAGVLPEPVARPPRMCPTPPRPPRVVPVCVEVVRVSLLEAVHGQCRDLGDDGLCCSRPTSTGSSWCADHRALYTRSRCGRAA